MDKDKETDEHKIQTMRQMMVEKQRKNQRDKILERNRNVNPFLESKKTVQLEVKDNALEPNIQAMIEKFEKAQQQQSKENDALEEEEDIQAINNHTNNMHHHFQRLTVNGFCMQLAKLTPQTMNADASVNLFEQINEFFRENCEEKLLNQFHKEGGLNQLLVILLDLNNFKPTSFLLSRILEVLAIFAQVKTFLDFFTTKNIMPVLISLCTEQQEQQVIEQLFSVLGFECSECSLEGRDHLRKTTNLLPYVCHMIDKHSFGLSSTASLIVRNGIWLLVSLCSDLPEDGQFDYCRQAVPIFIQFLKCSSGTVAQECTWVLESLCQYYLAETNPTRQESLKQFISLGLPMNLIQTFKMQCLTTTQCSLKVLTQLLVCAGNDDSVILNILNQKVISEVVSLINVSQRLLVYKVLMEFLAQMASLSAVISSLLHTQFIQNIAACAKSTDSRYKLPALNVLARFIDACSDQQLAEVLDSGVIFHSLAELLDASQITEAGSIASALSLLEKILEAISAGRTFEGCSQTQLRLHMQAEKSGILRNLENLQLSKVQEIAIRSMDLIERFFVHVQSPTKGNAIDLEGEGK